MQHSIYQQIWKTQQRPQDWKRSVFIPVRKRGKPNKCSKYPHTCTISHANKVMFRILKLSKLQQYMNQEPPDVQSGFRKSTGTRDQIAHIHWIIEKAREFQENIYFCFTASGPITSWQIDGETVETVTDYFFGLQNHCRWRLKSWN